MVGKTIKKFLEVLILISGVTSLGLIFFFIMVQVCRALNQTDKLFQIATNGGWK
jgi:hypothetical protein